VCEESSSDEDPMDVYYQKKSTTALQRQAQRIGAVPSIKRTQNFVYVTTYATTAITWTPLLVNGLTQGTGASNRIGRQIFMTHAQWKASASQLTRLLLIYDSQSNGAAPAIGDILQDPADPGFSPHNFQGRERFSYLFDSVYDLTPERAVNLTWKYMPIGLHTSYNDGNAGTVADITSGALYLFAYTSLTTVGISFNLYYEE